MSRKKDTQCTDRLIQLQPEAKNRQLALFKIQIFRSFEAHGLIHLPGRLHGHGGVNDELMQMFIAGLLNAGVHEEFADALVAYGGIDGQQSKSSAVKFLGCRATRAIVFHVAKINYSPGNVATC